MEQNTMHIIYVSGSGSDAGDGSLSSPFRSPEKAQETARSIPGSTVRFLDGNYRTILSFDERDNGLTYRAEEGVLLTGGITIDPDKLQPVENLVRSRFAPQAAPHIRVIDLADFGILREELGEVCPIGSYHTANRYDDAPVGENLEVFSGGRRMLPARYPNGEYLKIDAVLDNGEVNEFPSQNYWHDNKNIRNPRGGTYIIDCQTNERAKTWQNPETAWVFGYFYWDWADSSSPVSINTKNRAISPRFVSSFGCRPGALYYFYNILEELDAPGEYFLDRENLLLYVYPYHEEDIIEISLTVNPLIKAENVENLTLDGFTITSSRTHAVVLTGNNCTLRNLTVRNVAGHGIIVTGSGNLVTGCEITRTGRGGICLNGGDRTTLIPASNRAENNYIHHFSEIYQTYQPGIQLNGVGNICSHNEICFSPHMAIGYSGNCHLIEYNDIHDVVLHSSDAGAIYAGYDWCAHGTVIRYNRLRDIGANGFSPDGIYWDDGHSGQTAYGNILINVKKNSFLIGGGRDNVVRNNLIFGDTRAAIAYDDRNRDGFVNGGWAAQATNHPDAPHWVKLRAIPYTNVYWQEKFPQLSRLKTDLSTDPDDPDFPINPAGSEITGNIIIADSIGNIAPSVYRYSKVEDNHVYARPEDIGLDTETCTFSGQPEGFPRIPADEIGRK